jgi:hypothetical protein
MRVSMLQKRENGMISLDFMISKIPRLEYLYLFYSKIMQNFAKIGEVLLEKKQFVADRNWWE